MTLNNDDISRPSLDSLPNERVVLFMDILGFRDLIARTPKEPQLYFLIKNLLQTIQKDIYDHNTSSFT